VELNAVSLVHTVFSYGRIQFHISPTLVTKTIYMDRNVSVTIEIELHPYNIKERVASVSVNHGSLLSVPQNFRDMTQVHFAMRCRTLKHVYKQPTPTPPPKLGISLCSLAIYRHMTLSALPTPLCILYLVFHTNAAFLT
jgi:hypothetical protein